MLCYSVVEVLPIALIIKICDSLSLNKQRDMLVFVNSFSAVFYGSLNVSFSKFDLWKFESELILFLTLFHDFEGQNIDSALRVYIFMVHVYVPGLSLKRNFKILNYLLNATKSNVYWTVHHCNRWRMKDQLDVTCYFISLLMCSTCFGH